MNKNRIQTKVIVCFNFPPADGGFLFHIQHRFICGCLLGGGSRHLQVCGEGVAVSQGESHVTHTWCHSRRQQDRLGATSRGVSTL